MVKKKKENIVYDHVEPITNEMKLRAKKLVQQAKKDGKVLPHTAAFDKFSVLDEVHKGDSKYYL